MGLDLDMATPAASIGSVLIIGLSAFVFLVGLKWAANHWNVPGLKDLTNYV